MIHLCAMQKLVWGLGKHDNVPGPPYFGRRLEVACHTCYALLDIGTIDASYVAAGTPCPCIVLDLLLHHPKEPRTPKIGFLVPKVP